MTDYKIQTDEVLKFLANIDDKDLDYVKVSTSVARDMAHELQLARARLSNFDLKYKKFKELNNE
jgi:hypothetical protein